MCISRHSKIPTRYIRNGKVEDVYVLSIQHIDGVVDKGYEPYTRRPTSFFCTRKVYL